MDLKECHSEDPRVSPQIEKCPHSVGVLSYLSPHKYSYTSTHTHTHTPFNQAECYV